MREFRHLDPGERLPDNPGPIVFQVTAWANGVIGLTIDDDSGMSLVDVAGILHDMSISVAKYIIDRHEKAKEN